RRHFGHLHLWKSVDDCPGLNALGIDALSRDFTSHRFAAMLSASKRPLKDFLLDQSQVAGIGNIYSCESLWQARLDPRRRANTLKPREVRRLHKAIVSVLARALECCLHPAPNFRDPEWWFQGLERVLRVYDREGNPAGAAVSRSGTWSKVAVQLTIAGAVRSRRLLPTKGYRPIA